MAAPIAATAMNSANAMTFFGSCTLNRSIAVRRTG
jgi:hypothetical protein